MKTNKKTKTKLTLKNSTLQQIEKRYKDKIPNSKTREAIKEARKIR